MGNVAIVFVTLMFSLFPLYLSDRYYYIRHDKLYAFYVLASLLVIVMGSVLLTHYNQRDKENKIENNRLEDDIKAGENGSGFKTIDF